MYNCVCDTGNFTITTKRDGRDIYQGKKIIVFGFSIEEVEEVINFNTGRDLKRFTDKSVIWKSLQLKCPMLTGDRKMREVAEKMGL
jgi:hypothetical protein